MFSTDYLMYIMLFLILAIATNTTYKYYNYNNVFYKMYNAKQSSYWLKVEHLTTPTDIFSLISNYMNIDTKHNKVIEYTSLQKLRDKRLNNLNKYKDPYNYIIIIQNNLTDGKEVTDTFKNKDNNTIYSTYNPETMQVYRLKFVKTFYILVRIY